MARVCEVTGKRPMSGHNVSHSNRKTKRRFLPNLHERKIWCEDTGRFVRVRICRKGLKLIDKIGVRSALKRNES
jgi:large subunit ribosomal protein L28